VAYSRLLDGAQVLFETRFLSGLHMCIAILLPSGSLSGCVQVKPPKDETEDERLVRLEMEALAAEEKGRMAEV
jgi:hypothetical protein